MLLPDGTTLMHGNAPYDPVKAHEYYLRYRKLHPRQKGQLQLQAPHGYTVKTGKSTTVKLSSQQLEEQKVYAAARVTAIQKKLTELNAKLREKLVAAKKREADAKKPPTAAEKAAAAKASKAYRDKHHQQLANKAKAAAAKKAPAKKVDTVASLRKQITDTKASLTAAVAKQRELMAAKRNG